MLRASVYRLVGPYRDQFRITSDLEMYLRISRHYPVGILDEFVFMRVAFEPKGAMVRSIIASAQLRSESVMFMDDNPINRNEVSYYNPGIHTTGPELLPSLLDDPRFRGKDDSALARLRQYKILEDKEEDRSRFVYNANEFLRQSEIRLSFHYDVTEQFDRIHELINRSNQLNFTKLRLPENIVDARQTFEEQLSARDFHAAYIKVSDRYGDYRREARVERRW